jgi:hypothetical protein
LLFCNQRRPRRSRPEPATQDPLSELLNAARSPGKSGASAFRWQRKRNAWKGGTREALRLLARLLLHIDLITSLEEAQAAGHLAHRLAVLTHPSLLVVDEIGYLPINHTGAVLFFQLMNRRYEHASTVQRRPVTDPGRCAIFNRQNCAIFGRR